MFNPSLLKSIARKSAEQMMAKILPSQPKNPDYLRIVSEWVLFALNLAVQLYCLRNQLAASNRPDDSLNAKVINPDVSEPVRLN